MILTSPSCMSLKCERVNVGHLRVLGEGRSSVVHTLSGRPGSPLSAPLGSENSKMRLPASVHLRVALSGTGGYAGFEEREKSIIAAHDETSIGTVTFHATGASWEITRVPLLDKETYFSSPSCMSAKEVRRKGLHLRLVTASEDVGKDRCNSNSRIDGTSAAAREQAGHFDGRSQHVMHVFCLSPVSDVFFGFFFPLPKGLSSMWRTNNAPTYVQTFFV